MISEEKKKELEKQGYRFVGNHSAVKTCEWVRKSIRNQGVCYKQAFYNVRSWRCVQMTPSMNVCTHRCEWCWRDINHTELKWTGPVDEPKEIVDGCIEAQKELLMGFKGFEGSNIKRFEESMKPLQFAISLSGEPTAYPKLPGLVKELKERDIISFIVSNGTYPEMIEKLLKEQPTQMYLTLPAPNKEIYKKACKPLISDGWEKILESFSLLGKFDRSVARITCTKGINLEDANGYAEILKKSKPSFVEFKGFMPIGFARERLGYSGMPSSEEIKEFAEKVNNELGYKLGGFEERSRALMLWDGKTEKAIDWEK